MEALRRFFATNNRGLYAMTRFSTEHGSLNNIADLNYIFINVTENYLYKQNYSTLLSSLVMCELTIHILLDKTLHKIN